MEVVDLSRTAIQELQQSFGDVRAELFLSGCSHIAKFPEISGNMRKLCLDGTSIEEVPSSIQFLSNLRQLNMTNCKKLSRLPSNICKLKSLEYLDISNCSKLESFPEIMEPTESLRVLLMSGTAIRELPTSFRHLKYLCYLYLDGIFVKGLPKLPPPLQYDGKLKIISCSTSDDSVRELCFANCFKFDEKAFMADLQLKIQFGKIQNFFGMVSSRIRIPRWFSDQRTGSSITIQFPSNPPKLIAFVFCVVVLHPFVTYDV